MTDYWQIISLINEILTIYGCETFKIDHIKAEREREDYRDIYREEYVDSASMYFPDEDKPEDYERKYLPDLFICIDKNGIDIRVDRYVGAKNPDERMKGWKIEFKFIEDNLSDVIIKCIYPKNNIDFLGFKEAFNTEARKRISEMEKIIWGYSLHRLYNVDVSTRITDASNDDDEVKEYAEMHIEIYATAKDYKSINLSDEDIKALEEHLKRVNKYEPPINIDPHFGVDIDPHIDPRTGGILDPMVKDPIVVNLPSDISIYLDKPDKDRLDRQNVYRIYRAQGILPHTDVNHSNNDPLPEEAKKNVQIDEKILKDIRSDEAIMKKIDIKDIDSLWNGLVELFSQEHYSDCVKSETSIEYTQRFEQYFMACKNQHYSEEKITFELNKEENIIRSHGCIDGEPAWFLDFVYTEEKGLTGIYATSLKELEMLDLVHFAHVRTLIRQLADAGFLDKSV